jgi:predicted ATPase
MLGPLEVLVGGAPAALGAPKQRALLALLLVEVNRVVPLDRLVDQLWEGSPPPTAENAVRVYASSLRKAIGGALSSRAGGYVLESDEEKVDARRFERLFAEGRDLLGTGEPAEAAAILGDALALWRGRPLTDFLYAEWAQAEIARLEQLRLVALETRIDADLALGRHDQLVPELESLVSEHPLRERLCGQLMLAFYRCGRQADALAAYRKARSVLVGELGLEPGPELRDLEAAILGHDAALAVEPADLQQRRRLPAPATTLVGRRAEVEAVTQLLRGDARLVTVLGPGGIGKTRVAIQAAYELADRFTGGVVFVGLAAVRDPNLVPSEIATALGVEDSNGTLTEHLATRDLLLLIDNFEQVEEAAITLGSMLQEADGLKLLVTSRHPTRVYGEHRFTLEPLALEEEAVPLFVARAAAAGRRVDPTTAVREVCLRLDRLPLAIELAAARAVDHSPTELLALLPRLDLAAEGPRDVPERQRTLRAAIEWSVELLEPALQRLLARLSVFSGSFAAGTAEAVCDASPDQLQSLVDKSLLARDGDRYHLLETIRELAAERLDDDARALGRRHAEHFLELAREADLVTQGGEQASWYARLDDDHDNLRAALQWFDSNGEPERELQLAGALWAFWSVHGYINEGRRRLDGALRRGASAPEGIRAKALHGAGALAYRQGDYGEARALFEASLAAFDSAGDEAGAGKVLGELGNIAVAEGEYESALEHYARCAAALRKAGLHASLGQVIANMGAVANMQRDFERGRTLLEEALVLHRETGNADGAAIALHNLARVELRTGRTEEAAGYFRQALEIAIDLSYREVIAHCLEGLAEVSAAADAPRAARLIGAAEQMLDELGIAMSGDDAEMYEATIGALRDELGGGFEQARSEGRSRPLAEAIEEALAATGGAAR